MEEPKDQMFIVNGLGAVKLQGMVAKNPNVPDYMVRVFKGEEHGFAHRPKATNRSETDSGDEEEEEDADEDDMEEEKDQITLYLDELEQVVLVAPHRARVHVLATAEPGEGVGHHEDRRLCLAARDEPVEGARHTTLPGVRLEHGVSAAGEASQQEHHRERTVRCRREVHGHLPLGAIPQRVTSQRGALEAARLDPAGE